VGKVSLCTGGKPVFNGRILLIFAFNAKLIDSLPKVKERLQNSKKSRQPRSLGNLIKVMKRKRGARRLAMGSKSQHLLTFIL